MFSDTLLGRICERKRSSTYIDFGRLDIVIENLKFLYNVCIASEQLLIDAAKSTEALPTQAFHTLLSHYYWSHLEEERGEVPLLVEDLKSAGIDHPPGNTLAMAMIGTQYYLIKHAHPVALLGYMAVQEADPTPISAVEILEKSYGKGMFRFLRLHAIKDLEHRKELIEMIDLVPERLHALILGSAENALGYLAKAVQIWLGQ